MAVILVSLTDRESREIKVFCKRRGYAISKFLVRAAKREMREEPAVEDMRTGLWTALKGVMEK